MPVRLRLARWGYKRRPFFRVVAIESTRARNGKPLEYLGTYNPIPSADGVKEVRLNVARVKHWLAHGAEPTLTVRKLLWRGGLLPPPPIPFQTQQHIPKAQRREMSTCARDGLAPPLTAPYSSTLWGLANSPVFMPHRRIMQGVDA